MVFLMKTKRLITVATSNRSDVVPVAISGAEHRVSERNGKDIGAGLAPPTNQRDEQVSQAVEVPSG